MTCREILRELKSQGSEANRAGMARYGIQTAAAVGVSVTAVRKLARRVGRDHDLAVQLWDSGIHEARILATLTAEPARLTGRQVDRWVADVDSWDLCDLLCNNLLWKADYAWAKALQYSRRRGEFAKRAGFALMACLAVHDKQAGDERFLGLLEIIERAAGDERNFVKKAVNWALRQIGKRNRRLNQAAVRSARRIGGQDSRSARWIASDALRELTADETRRRLRAKGL